MTIFKFVVDRTDFHIHNRDHKTTVKEFIETKREYDRLNSKLSAMKEDMVEIVQEKFGNKNTKIVLGDDTIDIKFNTELKIIDEKSLKEALGQNFISFVNVSYKAKTGLRQLFATNPKVTKCLKLIDKKPTVSLQKAQNAK